MSNSSTPGFARRELLLAFLLAAGTAPSQELHPLPDDDAVRLKARVFCSCLFVQHLSMRQCSNSADAIWRYPYADAPSLLEPGQHLVTRVYPSGASVELHEDDTAVAQTQFVEDGGGCVTRQPGSLLAFPDEPTTTDLSPDPLPRASLPPAADAEAVQAALEAGFATQGPMAGFARAAIAAHEGRVVFERYAPGFGPRNRYYLGSISKVFNNLLAGLLVGDGKLRVEDPVGAPEWAGEDDPRRGITFDHLLHMTSGLRWSEDFFTPGAPAYNVYFAGQAGFDVAHYLAMQPLEAPPGAHFEYSTGASTLLARALQARLEGGGRSALLRYFSEELFQPIGASGVVPEFDAAGTFLAGLSVYARPEDLLRVGLLLLRDGVWDERRILPQGWLGYSTEPLTTIEEGKVDYGAQLMLQTAGIPGCFGHTGVGEQFLVVCPRRELVLVWFSSFYDFSGKTAVAPEEVLRKLVLAFPEQR